MNSNKLVLTGVNIVAQDEITTTTTTSTTTVTQWSRVPIKGHIYRRELAELANPSSTLTSYTGTSTNSLASSTDLNGILSDNTAGHISKAPLIIAIVIPLCVAVIGIAALLYWYFYCYRKRVKKHSWNDSIIHNYNNYHVTGEKFQEFATKDDPFSLENAEWELPQKCKGSNKYSTAGSATSGSLSTFSLRSKVPSLPCRTSAAGKGEKLEEMSTNYRIKNMTAVPHKLIQTPTSAIKKFFNRKSMAATIENQRTSLSENLPKPKRAALKSLTLVDRLNDMMRKRITPKTLKADVSTTDKENLRPQIVTVRQISKVPILCDPSKGRKMSDQRRRKEKQEKAAVSYKSFQMSLETLTSDPTEIYIVVLEYEAHLPDEMDLELGEHCVVELKHQDGWCLAAKIDNDRHAYKKGVVPVLCLQLIDDQGS
ncbi:hypothetical protein FOA43_000341 [Brettanomyces nanus]|uniref:SH3 domain-containing protein n=1 Tax=Eeniella nana TaxID=13502 RepID=A0A875RT07_EENNA|nr:uncharacterized protein FOA43_000341 [Brettanomyces nanus]QPG73037.1 hypothetical protein FOA43_000341 [Brettanomyces nanus]